VNSGRVDVAGNLTSLTLGGGMTSTTGSIDPSIIVAGHIGSIAIGGALNDAVIGAGLDISSIVINDDVTGSTISALGQIDPCFRRETWRLHASSFGEMSRPQKYWPAMISDGSASNADASIGSVRVVGNWTASDLVAGVNDAGSTGFGDADDTKIIGGTDRSGFVSQIGSVNISGAITGSAEADDHFGFVAQRILSFKTGPNSLAFNLAAGTSLSNSPRRPRTT
jgi:hypothetical protein